MKSKIRFVYFLQIIFISCSPDHSLEIKEKGLVSNNQQVRNGLTTQTAPNLIGKWRICERISGGLVINYYSCPNIEFYKSLTGVIINPSGEKESVEWIAEENTITFINKDATESNIISDGKYEIILTQENELTELKLNNIVNKK